MTRAPTARWRAGLAVVGAVMLAGCGGGGAEAPAPARDAPDGVTAKPAGAEGTESVELYFTAGEQFHPVERELPDSESPVEQAAVALVAGPSRREERKRVEAQTQIPQV